jgi:hypothetical protein
MHPLPYKTLVEEWLRALETTLSDGYLILQASDLEDSSRAGAGNILLGRSSLKDICNSYKALLFGRGKASRQTTWISFTSEVEVNATGLLDLTTCLEVDSFSNQLDQSQEPGIDDEDTSLNLARWILRKSLSETLFSTKLNRSFDFTN